MLPEPMSPELHVTGTPYAESNFLSVTGFTPGFARAARKAISCQNQKESAVKSPEEEDGKDGTNLSAMDSFDNPGYPGLVAHMNPCGGGR